MWSIYSMDHRGPKYATKIIKKQEGIGLVFIKLAFLEISWYMPATQGELSITRLQCNKRVDLHAVSLKECYPSANHVDVNPFSDKLSESYQIYLCPCKVSAENRSTRCKKLCKGYLIGCLQHFINKF